MNRKLFRTTIGEARAWLRIKVLRALHNNNEHARLPRKAGRGRERNRNRHSLPVCRHSLHGPQRFRVGVDAISIPVDPSLRDAREHGFAAGSRRVVQRVLLPWGKRRHQVGEVLDARASWAVALVFDFLELDWTQVAVARERVATVARS